MKQIRLSHLTLVFSSLFLVIGINAQDVKDRTVNNAEEKANTRIDTRVDEGLDKGLEAIEGLFKRKDKKKKTDKVSEPDSSERSSQSSSTQASSGSSGTSVGSNGYSGSGLNGMLTPATIDKDYSFDLVFDVELRTTKKNGKIQEMNNQMMFASGAYGMRPEESATNKSTTIIFDMDNESMIMLEEKKGKRTGSAMNMSKQFWGQFSEVMKQGTAADDAVITKTGRTKTILGKLCTEYTYKTSEHEGVAWMADFQGYDGQRLGQYLNVEVDSSSPHYRGFTMESETRELKSGEVSTWKVVGVDENANKSFVMSDWEVEDIMGKKY